MRSAILGTCTVLAMFLAGCEEEQQQAEGASESTAEETPAQRAKTNDKEGAAALAVSDKGVDEEGNKTWKQEAREFYDATKNPKNRIFEMSRQWALDLTNKLYTAGAEKVWVTRIDATEIGGQEIFMSDDLLIVLPSDPAKRKKVFDTYNGAVEDVELKYPDVGQKFIHVVAD